MLIMAPMLHATEPLKVVKQSIKSNQNKLQRLICSLINFKLYIFILD